MFVFEIVYEVLYNVVVVIHSKEKTAEMYLSFAVRQEVSKRYSVRAVRATRLFENALPCARVAEIRVGCSAPITRFWKQDVRNRLEERKVHLCNGVKDEFSSLCAHVKSVYVF